jgi:tripartite-type tricarboxylate transporter receptor subunit TctC
MTFSVKRLQGFVTKLHSSVRTAASVCANIASTRIPQARAANHKRHAMKLPRRQFLHLAAGATALPAVSRFAWAQAYPTRPITMIVPFAPGTAADAVARVLAERMRRVLGQPIIIENVGGAGGSIGTGRVARARPDGYTIDLGVTSTHALNGAFYSLPYDVLNDFAPVSALGTSASIFYAKKTMPAKDLRELIDWLRANPNKASAEVVTAGWHLLTAFFQKETATQFTFVPYRSRAMQDLLAGQIDLLFNVPDALPLVRAGSIKAYAVASDTRLALAPDIPTFGEMGLPTISYSAWWGLFAPKGTPGDIIGTLNAAIVEAIADPAVRSRLVDLGVEVFPRERQTPEALGVLVKADAEKWWPIIKEFGIRAE